MTLHLLHELNSLPLLLLSQPLSPLSLLETLTERVIIVKFHVLTRASITWCSCRPCSGHLGTSSEASCRSS